MNLSALLPKEEKFYRYLEDLAERARICAVGLKTYVESADAAERTRATAAITGARLEAKSIAGEVTRELCRSFVTPFDREDIQDFSSNLYRIAKTIDKIRERLDMHGISSSSGDFSRQTDLIVREAEAMHDMVAELVKSRNARHITDKVAVFQDLESRGDAVLGELLVSLFRDTKDPRTLILRKDIYDMLEKVIDRYRDAAGVAMQIVLKHS